MKLNITEIIKTDKSNEIREPIKIIMKQTETLNFMETIKTNKTNDIQKQT